MSIIGDIRAQHKEYDDLSDGQLAYKLWNAKYNDMPMGMFADKVGLSQDAFGEMIGTAKQSGYEPTSRTTDPNAPREDLGITGMPRAALSGMTLGGSDEAVAGMTAAGRKLLQGDERKLGDIYQQELEAERARIAQYKETDPIKAGVAEFAGGMAIPLGAANTLKGAAGVGAGLGFTSGALSAEDNRLQAGVGGAFLGGLLGPAFYKGGDLLQSQFGRAFKQRAQKAVSEGAPSVEALKREASDAYKMARSKGATIDPTSYAQFVDDIIRGATDNRGMTATRSKLMPQTSAVLKEAYKMKQDIGKQIGIDDLDELRQLAQVPASNIANKQEQRAAMSIIRGIDSFVENLTPQQLSKGAPDVGESLKAARSAWQKMRKTEGVEKIIDKSANYAGGLESGIKNQINAILRNDKKRAQYTEAEIQAMKDIVEGSPIGNLIGNVSQLGLSATGGRNAFNVGSGAIAGGGAGFALGGPAGAAIGALMEMAGTTALRYVREMNMKNQLALYRDLVASGKINEFAYKSPEALKLLQAVAQRAGQGTIATTAPEMQ